MNKEFAKGNVAYSVECITSVMLNGPVTRQWSRRSARIRSSGKKWVTLDDGRGTRFRASEKPVLMSEHGEAYLVSTAERADALAARLSEDEQTEARVG